MARIVTNTSANTVYKNYGRNQGALASSLEKLATGLRINRAADDPAGLAISETLRAQVKGSDAVVDVIANATNFVNTADGYLQTVNDILGRMEELAVKMGDGTLSTGDKDNVVVEFESLRSEITNLDTDAKFNGSSIFGADKTFTIDPNGISEFTVSATDALTSLATVSGGITSLTNGDNGLTQVGELNTQIAAVARQRAALGASQSTLSFRSLSTQNYSENVAAAESRIRNVDIAKESASFSRNQILVQSATAMLAQANASGQVVLSLLR